MEKLAGLKVLHPEIEGFSITAGNASGSNDGASALVVASDAAAAELGPRAAGDRPVLGVGRRGPEGHLVRPIKVIPKALRRIGLDVDDVDLYEINEAFASMTVACVRLLEIDPDIVNVNGSGCSIGHPIAATGGRMLSTLIYQLRRQGGGLGVAAMSRRRHGRRPRHRGPRPRERRRDREARASNDGNSRPNGLFPSRKGGRARQRARPPLALRVRSTAWRRSWRFTHTRMTRPS